MEQYQFVYLIGDSILAIVWLALFFLRKDLRKQQLFMSCLLAPFAPLTDFLWFYHDYWRPEYILSVTIGKVVFGIESPLFAFLFGGIAGVLYEAVFRKRHVYGKSRSPITILIIFSTLILSALFISMGLNSIWATSLASLCIVSIALIIDRDIIKDALRSGILMTLLIITVYVLCLTMYPEVIQKFWIPESLSGIKLWKIPIEELVWSFAAGMSLGVLYEFWFNVEKYPKR